MFCIGLCKKTKGWLYLSLPIVTMCAFSIEGLCNHIGNKKIDFWKEIERSISIKSKINILMKTKKDFWGREPWQTVSDIFGIRDMLAHPKGEIIKEMETLELSDEELENHPYPQKKWQTTMDMEKIHNIMEKTKNAMKELCEENNIDTHDIYDTGSWTRESTTINT